MPQLHHLLAVPAASLAAGFVAVDTIVLLATGQRTAITDDSVNPIGSAIGSVPLGIVFALLSWTVHRERDRFSAGNRALRIARRPLTVGLGVLAVGIGVVHPIELLAGVTEDSTWGTASSLVAFAVLAITQLSAMVVGVAALRRNPLGVGGRLLGLVLPTIALTILLALVVPNVADPALVSMVTVLGVALIGVRARDPRPVTESAPVAAAA